MTTGTRTKSLAEILVPEFDQEVALTRKAIERAPEDKLQWKPHPRSNDLEWLIGFLSFLPSWAVSTFEQDSLDLMPGGKPPEGMPPWPKTVKEALAFLDANAAKGRATLAQASDEAMGEPWRLLMNGKEVLKATRYEVMRSSVINHLVHHRAQLGVYLRLLDVPVPATYGPSADDNPWRPA